MLLKQYFRYIFNYLTNYFIRSDRFPIVIGSMRKAGSTFLYLAVQDILVRERFPNLPIFISSILCQGVIWLPGNKLFKGLVKKSNVPAKEFPSNSSQKVIYVFCQPSESILSAIGMKERKCLNWIKGCFHNLLAKGLYEKIFYYEILKIRENVIWWKDKKVLDILMLRYEKIWHLQKEIETFLNLKIDLPNKTERRKISLEAKKMKNILKENYDLLEKEISSIPDLIQITA